MDDEKIWHGIKENVYPFHLARLLFLDHWTQWGELERERVATNLQQQVHPKQEAYFNKNDKWKQINKQRILL